MSHAGKVSSAADNGGCVCIHINEQVHGPRKNKRENSDDGSVWCVLINNSLVVPSW